MRGRIAGGLTVLAVAGSLAAAGPARAVTVHHNAVARVSANAWIDSAHPSTSHVGSMPAAGLPVGLSGGDVSRTVFTFALPALPPGAVINQAVLDLTETGAASCTPTRMDVVPVAASAAPTWNGQQVVGPVTGSTTVAKGYSPACPAGPAGVDVTSAIRHARGARQPAVLELRAHDETDPAAFKRFSPVASVLLDYDSPPTTPVPSFASPRVPCTTGAGRPLIAALDGSTIILSAVARDGDVGESISTTFTLYRSDHTTVLARLSSGQMAQGSRSVQMPSGLLSDGETFAWRATSSDGQLTSAPSAWCEATVDNAMPSAPIITSPTLLSGLAHVGDQVPVTVSGGGSLTTEYVLYRSQDYSTQVPCGFTGNASGRCVRNGADAHFTFRPDDPFGRICALAIAVTGRVSNQTCEDYSVQPALPTHRWVTDGAATTATQLADTGTAGRQPLALNGVSWAPDGRLAPDGSPVGPSLAFTAAGRATTTGAALDTAHPFTAGVWVDPAATQAAFVLTAGQFGIGELPDGSWVTCLRDACAVADGSVAAGTWTYLAAVWDGGQLHLYVGGTEAADASPISGQAGDGSARLALGGWLTGEMEGPAVWNVALPAAQVRQLAATYDPYG